MLKRRSSSRAARPRRREASRRQLRRILQLESLETRRVLDAAQLTIFVDSEEVAIPANIGVAAGGARLSQIVSLANGQLDLNPVANEPLETLTLGDFFTTWRTNAGQAGNNANAVLSSSQLLGNQVGGGDTIQMFVNGQVSTELADYEIQDNDNIILVFGDNPIVSLVTNFGPIVVELFAADTPVTVNNFLNYVNDGDYINSFFHRNSIRDPEVVQGGGFRTSSTTFTSTAQFSSVPGDPPIVNEPGLSNVRSTIAMAKFGGQPNSATNQFYFNVLDNTGLDSPANSGGFTVFGQVLDMATLDLISGFTNRALSSPYGELPVSEANQLAVIQAVAGQGEVTGKKFIDLNNDGDQDTGEPNLAGAVVYADLDNNGQRGADEPFAVTDANGNFTLQLPSGSRTLRSEVLGAGRNDTTPGGARTVAVPIGRSVAANFSEGDPTGSESFDASVSGFVFTDTNGNGAMDAGEMGVPGVEITLTGTQLAQGAAVTRTMLTLDDGSFRFAALGAGTYTLTERQPMALMDGLDRAAAAGAVVGADSISNLVVAAGQRLSGNLFGEGHVTPQSYSISWFFTSSQKTAVVDRFRELIAAAEQNNGDSALAAAIRNGGGTTSDEETPGGDDDPPANDTNSNPVAVADAYPVAQGGVLNVLAANGVLFNDTDADQDVLTASVVRQPANGALSLASDGAFVYTPLASFSGTDSFTYRASDGQGTSAETTVTITVQGANRAPVARADMHVVDEDTDLVVLANDSLLLNDTDADGDSLTAQVASNPQHGTVTLAGNGTFTYRPAANFSGQDTFTYAVNDGQATSAPALVTIEVLAVNDVPVAADDAYAIASGATLVVTDTSGVLSNDTDVETARAALTVSVVTPPTNGALALSPNGSFNYTPDGGFVGVDTFVYRVSDGDDFDDATVQITVSSSANTFSVLDDAVGGAVVGAVTSEAGLDSPSLFQLANPELLENFQLRIDDHVEGPVDASVVLIEYLDFQCPTCKAYHPFVQALQGVFEDDLLVVRRHFPLNSPHPRANAAAQAAEAAELQQPGAFELMADKLFENQDDWTDEAVADPATLFRVYAQELGLDPDQLVADMASQTVQDRINRDLAEASNLELPGTPTFVLNGQLLSSNPLPSQQQLSTLIQDQIDAIPNTFIVNRQTGELTLAANATLDAQATPTHTFDVLLLNASGQSEVVRVTVIVNDAEGGEGSEGESRTESLLQLEERVDQVFAEEGFFASL